MIGVTSLLANAKVSSKDFSLYTIPSGVEDLAFRVDSKDINRVLRSKKIISKNETVFALSYWYKGKWRVELGGAEKVSQGIQDLILESFSQKSALVWGNSFSKWIKGYSVESRTSRQVVYNDPSGLLEKSEVLVNRSRKKIVINEKKPIGTIRTSINLSYPKWAGSKPVLKSSLRVAYEGTRVLKTETKMIYKKFDANKYLPNIVRIHSTQSVTFESASSINREIAEEFEFSDYKVNQGLGKTKI